MTSVAKMRIASPNRVAIVTAASRTRPDRRSPLAPAGRPSPRAIAAGLVRAGHGVRHDRGQGSVGQRGLVPSRRPLEALFEADDGPVAEPSRGLVDPAHVPPDVARAIRAVTDLE